MISSETSSLAAFEPKHRFVRLFENQADLGRELLPRTCTACRSIVRRYGCRGVAQLTVDPAIARLLVFGPGVDKRQDIKREFLGSRFEAFGARVHAAYRMQEMFRRRIPETKSNPLVKLAGFSLRGRDERSIFSQSAFCNLLSKFREPLPPSPRPHQRDADLLIPCHGRV